MLQQPKLKKQPVRKPGPASCNIVYVSEEYAVIKSAPAATSSTYLGIAPQWHT